MTIKVLIADSLQLFREGLVNLMKETEDLEVIAEAGNGRETVDKALESRPDIALIDVGMAEMSGIDAAYELKDKLPEMKLLGISSCTDKQYIKGFLEARTDGFLLKSCSFHQLSDAIRTVYSGKKYLSDEVTEIIINGYISRGDAVLDNYFQLSEREREIFKLYAEGKSTKEIGEQLFISVKTVGTHKQHIFEKLNINSTAEMVKIALRNGVIKF